MGRHSHEVLRSYPAPCAECQAALAEFFRYHHATPTTIHDVEHATDASLRVTWNDHHTSSYSFRYLRSACANATSAKRPFQPGADEDVLRRAEPTLERTCLDCSYRAPKAFERQLGFVDRLASLFFCSPLRLTLRTDSSPA